MRRTPRLPRAVTLGALALVAAACSSDAPSAPTPSSGPLDVARLLTDMTLPTDAASSAAGLAMPLPRFPDLGSCPYDAAARSFACPPVTASGLTASLTYALLDAAGNPQSQPDRATTASIRTLTTVSGTVSVDDLEGIDVPDAPAGTFTVSQRQELTLSGLLTGRRVLDGRGTGTIEGTMGVGGVAAPLRVTTTHTIAGVVLPTGTAGNARWPSAGTITTDMSMAGLLGGATSFRVQLAFNGTSRVTVTTTFLGVTERCTFDLERPREAPVCAG